MMPADRQFSAFARPQGRPEIAVCGPVIEVHERQRHGLVKVKVLTLAEAGQLHAELGATLRTFAVARALAADPDRPRAYTGPYPIRGHGTLAEVDCASSSAAVGARENV